MMAARGGRIDRARMPGSAFGIQGPAETDRNSADADRECAHRYKYAYGLRSQDATAVQLVTGRETWNRVGIPSRVADLIVLTPWLQGFAWVPPSPHVASKSPDQTA